MPTINDNLTSLYLAVQSAQSSLSSMTTAITSVSQQLGDAQRQSAQINADIGRAAINMRDAVMRAIVASDTQLKQSLINCINALQPLTDSKGNYIRDAQNNFTIG